MSRNLVYIGVVVLAVIAIILGYKIYQQQPLSPNQPTTSTTPPSTLQQDSSKSTQSSAAIQQKPTSSQTSAADIAAVLTFPSPNATEEERKKWGEKVISLAQTADVLEINSCKPEPTVLLVKQGAEVTVKNTGQVGFTLFAFGNEYNSSPGSTTSFKVNPKEEKGNHGYSCRLEGGSQIPVVSGIFLVN